MQGETISSRLFSIRREVKAAFGKAEPPEADRIVKSQYPEPLQIRDYFAGKNWWDITLQGLFGDYVGDASACLTFMTPIGVEYYLPAYLLMAAEFYYEGGVVTEDFAYGLKRTVMREDLYGMSLYGGEKKKAIVVVVGFLWNEYGDEEALEAMRVIALRWGEGVEVAGGKV
ncbi:hypothetical protein [Pseudomonas sp. UFMG81]|uniref:hypothetical protein n=1 Tax=Pseudomonas sp. UFMG81 TaxID=2745936 RepID=UPI00188F6046|nr:hypothetical protein [Pseudomonas sp. UFMG81]